MRRIAESSQGFVYLVSVTGEGNWLLLGLASGPACACIKGPN